jgi:glycosyltransferase involved in cell wall biosynthesis
MAKVAAVMRVKNEEQLVRYAIQSVQPFVDDFIVIDDGSTDRTISEVRSVGVEPILTDGSHDNSELRNMGAEAAGDVDWIWVVDSDEVYTRENGKKMREAIEENNGDYDISLLKVKWINFIRDRFHWDNCEDYIAIRAYRKMDIRWYGDGLQEAPARNQSDLRDKNHGAVIGVSVIGDYTKDTDVCFYHYSRCDTLLERAQKWYRHISFSNPDLEHETVAQETMDHNWVRVPVVVPFDGPQPEVFSEA